MSYGCPLLFPEYTEFGINTILTDNGTRWHITFDTTMFDLKFSDSVNGFPAFVGTLNSCKPGLFTFPGVKGSKSGAGGKIEVELDTITRQKLKAGHMDIFVNAFVANNQDEILSGIRKFIVDWFLNLDRFKK